MENAMRAVIVNEFGGPEVLQVAQAPTPKPCHSEVLVKVHAAGLNPIDIKTRRGAGFSGVIDRLPWIPGGEFAGVVESAPYELAEFQPGDEVYGMLLTPRYPGSHAEFVVAPMMSVAHKPASLSMLQAGGVPLAALTAWECVVEAARVHSGQRMLVHAGAGGVGHFAVQLASFYGAEVIATASAGNLDWLRELGASQVIDYKNEQFEDVITDGVDVVIDLIGNVQANTASRSLAVLRDGGLIVNAPSGSWPTMHEEIASSNRDLKATSIKLQPKGTTLATLGVLFDSGNLQIHVDASFPLEEARVAHELLALGHTRGKIVFDLIGS